MGRQAYMTRLVLGRSAFDPPEPQVAVSRPGGTSLATTLEANGNATENLQQYDAHGNPECKASRDAIRRSRRALNDILASAGICVSVKDAKSLFENCQNDIDSKSKASDSSINVEEEIGFWLQMSDSFAQWLVGHAFASIRLKMLAFPDYRLSLEEAIDPNWYRGGVIYLLRGIGVHALYNVLELLRQVTLELLFEDAIDPLVNKIRPIRKRAQLKRLTNLLNFTLDKATGICLVSLELHASLQQLDLVWQPLIMLKPFETSLRFWSWLLLPKFPALWTLKSLSKFLASLAISPPILFIALQFVLETKRGRTSRLLEEFFPSPVDRDSMFSTPGDGIATIVSKHFRAFYNHAIYEVQGFWSECKNMAKGIGELACSRIQNMSLESTLLPISFNFLEEETSSETDLSSPRPESPTAPEDDAQVLPQSNVETNPARPTTPSIPSSPPMLMEDGIGDETDMPSYSGQEAGRNALLEALTTTSSTSSTQDHIRHDKKRKHYNTNSLSTHAADTLRYHIHWVIWDFLLIPLESLYARSLAQSYFSTQLQSRTSHFPFVYPLGSWCGAGSLLQRTQYMRNMFVCVGAEAAVSYGVWQVTTGMAWWAGKRWFRWGRL